MPGGSQVKVNDNNKIDYLNKLAQYRLVTTVSEEIQYFLKGLYVYLIIMIFNLSTL